MPLSNFEKEFPVLVNALHQARRNQRLASAYLVAGDDESLRYEFAIALAQTAYCLNPSENGTACGSCQVCRQLANGSYSELFTLMPASKSRQITIGKDENDPDTMRWFRSFFHLSSTGAAGGKVGLIIDADCLNHAAQNAFLKTLEEPLGRVLFLLITGNPLALQSTIRSRCQTITLLRNRCQYGFDGIDELRTCLLALTTNERPELKTARQCATKLIAIANSLHEQAETSVTEKWSARLEQMENLDARARKQLEERCKAAIEAEYKKRRNAFLSLIHSWFGQIYLLSCDAPIESLANPELFSDIEPQKLIISEKRAAKLLRSSENLLAELRWNVKEELAIEAFALSL